MNCILLLLLLSCCGGGRRNCECAVPYDNCDCRREPRRESRESCNGRNSGFGNSDRRDSGRRPGGCGCENGSPARESNDCGCAQNDCGCAQNDRDANGPGLIPPPWQEYPKFSHRDDGDDCES